MQTLKLDINPKGEIPVLHAAQYDNGRLFAIELVEGENAYNVPSGYSVQLNVRKTDSKLVIKVPESVVDNIITFVTTEQMTACAGNNIASLTLKDAADTVITTLYFIIEVQRDVTSGGLESKSEIDNLTQQIDDIAHEVIGEDYYDKTEVDNALSLKANSADLATVATTGDYDDLINKPVIPAAQIQSDYAQADNTQVDYIKNKPDINAMIAAAIFNILPVGTASGNPCSFDTEIAGPLQGLTAEIVASGGGGTPATPIPIVGHSELNLDVNGDTFTVQFGQTVYGGVYDANSGKVRITHSYGKLASGGWTHPATFAQGAFLTISPFEDIKLYDGFDKMADALCNVAPIATPAQIAQGTLGVGFGNGNFFYLCIDTSLVTTSDLDDFLDNNDVYVKYELATPIEIDVSSISPSAVVGTNTITSDCGGDVNVSYKDSIQHYIDNH